MTFVKNHWITFVGIIAGAIGGYIYYHFWGCTNGCPIKSSPWKMMIYGTIMGGLFFNIVESEIKKRKK